MRAVRPDIIYCAISGYGNGHPLMAPYESFRTADREIVIAVTDYKTWTSFCALPECAALAAAPRFATSRARVASRFKSPQQCSGACGIMAPCQPLAKPASLPAL